jgi:hypothetical protein
MLTLLGLRGSLNSIHIKGEENIEIMLNCMKTIKGLLEEINKVKDGENSAE